MMIGDIKQKLDYLRKATDYSTATRDKLYSDYELHLKGASPLAVRARERYWFFERAGEHEYKLGPCLAEATVLDAERENGATLPEGYRLFLLEVGNGGEDDRPGAGPGYGLYSLEQSLNDLIGKLSEPFPYVEIWEPDPEAFDDFVQYEQDLFGDYHVQGTMIVAHHGCAIHDRLVVTGSERGNVWTENFASDNGIKPIRDKRTSARLDFLAWYEAWLDEAIGYLDS